MKKYIPNFARHRMIKGAAAIAAPAPAAVAPMTVVKLPVALAGGENCAAPLICRQTQSDVLAHVWLWRSYVFNGEPPESYTWMGPVRGFALRGTLKDLTVLHNENHLPAGFADPQLGQVSVALEGIDRIMPEVSDFDALADSTLLFMGSEIMSVAAAKLVNGIYSLTVLRYRFGTYSVHQSGDPLWILQRARLKVFSHPFFSGNAAKFKITIGKQPLANAIPFEVKL